MIGAVVTKVEIARRHLIGRGAEASQTTGVGAFIRVGQYSLVGVVVCGFCLPGLYFSATGFRFGLGELLLSPVFLGDAGDIVFRVHVVDVVGVGLVERDEQLAAKSDTSRAPILKFRFFIVFRSYCVVIFSTKTVPVYLPMSHYLTKVAIKSDTHQNVP